MQQDYFILQSGRLKRKQNTLYFENVNGKKPIPVNNINSIYAMGELDINSKLLVFLAQNKIPVHFFNYYGFYSGTFYPKEQIVSGFSIVNQARAYLTEKTRIEIAKEIIISASYNILQNLIYYQTQGKLVDEQIKFIEEEREKLNNVESIPELMGMEGNIRMRYYQTFNSILRAGFEMENRVKRPPDNMINCLISFGNSLLYTTTLSEIYKTQLNPTISYLHEPGERRFSLSLDISEVFKPIIVDKIIFNLINNRIIKEEHFQKELNFCYLNDNGKKLFLQHYDEKLKTKIKHKELKRNVSLRRLIRLECYKLIKHILGDKKYDGLKIWW